MKKTLLLILVLFVATSASAQRDAIFGKWKTIDDNTGKARSVVEIYEKDGEAYAKIVELFREEGEEENPICDECDADDDRYNQPVRGMEIMRGLEYSAKSNEWDDGKILDPENGKVYECKIWVDEESGNLRVRGYILFLYRTQTWLPYEG